MNPTVKELDERARRGEPVGVDEYKEAIAREDAAKRLTAIQEEGKAERAREARNINAQSMLDQIERDLQEFLDNDPRAAILEEIRELTDRYKAGQIAAIKSHDSLRSRYHNLLQTYTGFEPENVEVGHGIFKIGNAVGGSPTQGITPKEAALKARASEIATILSPPVSAAR